MSESQNKSKRRILVVDDEADIAQSIKTTLEGRYNVDIFTDPLKVVADPEAGSYDLYLIDYLMPGLDGLKIYQKLKEINPDANVCIMTAFELSSSEALRDSIEQLKFPLKTHIIRKPFDRKEILDKIEVLLT